MRKISVVLFLSVIMLASCVKSNDRNCSTVNVTAPASEVEALRTYLHDNNITATEDSRGFFYQIVSAGNATKPNVCDVITFDYAGKLTNGTQFDAGSNVTYYLSNLIVGWQEGIPLIGVGGSIKLYLPPSLGYGSSANGDIPANSNLIFDVSLSDVQ